MRVVPLLGVDPGHGGSKDGAWSPSHMTREADLTLAVAQAVKRLDPTIYLTRDGDQTIPYHRRSKLAADVGVEFMVCLHYDSTPWAPQAHGCHLYYGKDDEFSKEIAWFGLVNVPDDLRGGRVICAYDNPDIREDDWKGRAQYLCDVYRCPVLLVELGYLSNAGDLKYLIQKVGIEDCAAFVLECLRFARKKIGARNVTSGSTSPLGGSPNT